MPKSKKVRWVIKVVERDGWVWVRTTGDHRHYKHPTKPGLVTIPGKPGDTLTQDTQKSILRQAGLDEEEVEKWNILEDTRS